jgi:small subunit ribosomal protein S2
VVVDVRKEYIALREAKKLGVATIGLIDTDSDPDTVDVAIPANDDSIRAIELILNELADAVAIGKTMVAAKERPKQRPKRVRSRRAVLARADGGEAEAVAVAEEEPAKTAELTSVEEEKVAEPTSVEEEKVAEPTSVEEEKVAEPVSAEEEKVAEAASAEEEKVAEAASAEEEKVAEAASQESKGEQEKPEQTAAE